MQAGAFLPHIKERLAPDLEQDVPLDTFFKIKIACLLKLFFIRNRQHCTVNIEVGSVVGRLLSRL